MPGHERGGQPAGRREIHLAAHKLGGVRQASAAPGASLFYLPPSSPDLNPIEQLFAKLEALLRKAAARSKDELWRAIGHLLATVPPSERASLPQALRLRFHLK